MKITTIIIAKNQEKEIGACLKRLQWTDEQIVVDNESQDGTVIEAKKTGAIVISFPGKDFAKLRNVGAQKSSNEWLLYIDTDEEVTESLREEIKHIVTSYDKKKGPQAYIVKRKNYYLGARWPRDDGMIRLIYKPSLIEWFGDLHETAKIDGAVGELKEKLIHRTHRTLEEMVAKTNEWSAIEAKLRFDTNHPPVVPWRIFRVLMTGFFDSYINQEGWKAGTVGFIESMYQGFSLFITYAKLWEMQHGLEKKS